MPAKKPGAGGKRKPPRRPPAIKVVAALKARLAEFPDTVAGSPLAASALALARELDKAGGSASGKASCHRQLTDALERLEKQAAGAAPKPEGATGRSPQAKGQSEGSRVDDLEQRRIERRNARRADGSAET